MFVCQILLVLCSPEGVVQGLSLIHDILCLFSAQIRYLHQEVLKQGSVDCFRQAVSMMIMSAMFGIRSGLWCACWHSFH